MNQKDEFPPDWETYAKGCSLFHSSEHFGDPCPLFWGIPKSGFLICLAFGYQASLKKIKADPNCLLGNLREGLFSTKATTLQ